MNLSAGRSPLFSNIDRLKSGLILHVESNFSSLRVGRLLDETKFTPLGTTRQLLHRILCRRKWM